MDKSVFITIGAMVLLAGSFIGFKAITKKECVQPVVSYEPQNPEPGQMVKFSCVTDNDNQINWSFGDSTSPVSTGKETMHAFTGEGSFVVKAALFEACETEIAVNVATLRKMATVQPSIVIPDILHAGEVSSFADQTSEATGWKWVIKETGESGDGKNFNTTFPKNGKYTLHLSVNGTYINGDTTINLDVLKAIVVKKAAPEVVYVPKPKPEPKPAPAPAPSKYMGKEEFSAFFIAAANSLADGESNASDDWIKIVDQTCINGTMLVDVIDETGIEIPMKLENFKKKQLLANYYSVKSVVNITRASTNCIKEIKIKVERNKD